MIISLNIYALYKIHIIINIQHHTHTDKKTHRHIRNTEIDPRTHPRIKSSIEDNIIIIHVQMATSIEEPPAPTPAINANATAIPITEAGMCLRVEKERDEEVSTLLTP